MASDKKHAPPLDERRRTLREVWGLVNIQTTMIYMHLENALNKTVNDEFHVKVAQTPEAIKQPAVGFTYICDMHRLKFFRKRK